MSKAVVKITHVPVPAPVSSAPVPINTSELSKLPPPDKYYRAAYRIMNEELGKPELACPSSRRIAVMDSIAKIIKECVTKNG